MNINENPKTVNNKGRKSNLYKLANDSLESFYWIGFLLADGTFYNNGRITCILSAKDVTHLKKYAEFIESSVCEYSYNNYSYCKVATMHKDVVSTLMNKFDIKPNKTYNPPNIAVFEQIPKDALIAMICGFIDGDGSIKYNFNRKDMSIAIKNHCSWVYFLEYILKNIQEYFQITIKSKVNFTNCKRYCHLVISNNLLLFKLKQFAINSKLPIMSRKWDKIEFIENKTIISEKRKQQVAELLREHKDITARQIADTLNIKATTVHAILKRNKSLFFIVKP
jgi:hypothetical protein